MRGALILLVTLQVLVCTLGQGALTLCVRRDGSQRIEWTAHSDCHEHQLNHDTSEPDDHASCDICTDYVLLAPLAPSLSHQSPEMAPVQWAILDGLVTLEDGDDFTCHLSLHGPPRQSLASCLVMQLRC